MNDFELEAKLNAVRIPERTDEYWNDFPSRIRIQLLRSTHQERVCRYGVPQWGRSTGLAFACALFFFSLLPAFHAALKDERTLQREANNLPRNMQLLMGDEHGMQNVIADCE